MATTTVIGNVIKAVTNNIATIKSAIGNATTSAAGLMTTTQVTKLNGIADGATKTAIVNNLTATTAGSALDAVQGKALSDQISTLNSSLTNNTFVMTSGLTTAGLHTSCVCDVCSVVITKSSSGRYTVLSWVTAMQTVTSTDSTIFDWLSVSALLKPIMNNLGVSNINLPPIAYYPCSGDMVSDKGYGLWAHPKNTYIEIGRNVTTAFTKGGWPVSVFKTNTPCSFMFVAEVY